MRLKLCVTNDEHTGARFQMVALADLVGEPGGCCSRIEMTNRPAILLIQLLAASKQSPVME
jgi:hypothetical protein